MGFNEVGDPANPVGRAEHEKRRERERNVDAIQLERAPEEAAGHRLEAVFARPRHIDQADRQAGEEDERLGAVREPEVPRSQIFEQVARNVIHQDHDQHRAPPKINVADTVCVHHQAPRRKNGATPRRVPATPEGSFSGYRRRTVRRDPALRRPCNERVAPPPITFANIERRSPRIDRNVAPAM